jgi:hypothetical protein
LQQPQVLGHGATALILAGNATNLKNGDRLLILPNDDTAQAQETTAVKVTIATDSKTTEADLDGWEAPPPPRYTPASFQDNPALSGTTLVQGDLSLLQAAVDIPHAATLLLDSAVWWNASDIVAAAQANQWPLDQLAATMNQQAAIQSALADGSVHVFRQQVSPFGYNAPNYYSLPPALRFPSIFADASPVVSIPAAYPSSVAWDADPSSGTGEFTLDKWSISGVDYIYLDSTYTQIVPGSYISLHMDDGSAPLIAAVQSNTTVSHSQFSISGKISRLIIIPASNAQSLSQFKLRHTSILCQSEPLPLAQVPIEVPLDTGNSEGVIALDGAYPGLSVGQSILLSGQTLVNFPKGQLSGPIAGEARTLAQVQMVGGFTVITLGNALDNLYQRSTVKINANVALSTHGQSIVEVLGSGDGTQTFQSFILHQAPLTYVRSDDPSGSASTLEIRVDGALWTEVPFFYGHGPTEHIYITSQDDAGVTTVIFGDGITGSRLPTGPANIRATYRYGIGTNGLVRANQLSQLMSRPLGVRGVNNPLSSTGAADPEDLENGRGRATLTIMTLDRVVSLEDYQDFAKAFVGISKALATWTWNGQQRMVVLSVAGAKGPIDPSDAVLTSLVDAINKVSEPGVLLKLFPYSPIYFNLNATVTVAADLVASDVQTNVESALRSKFGFDARDFGQPVYQSEVIAAMQDVRGVIDVSLVIYRSDDPDQTPQSQIPAKVPQPGGRNQVFAAELLTIDPGTLDITVTQ